MLERSKALCFLCASTAHHVRVSNDNTQFLYDCGLGSSTAHHRKAFSPETSHLHIGRSFSMWRGTATTASWVMKWWPGLFVNLFKASLSAMLNVWISTKYKKMSLQGSSGKHLCCSSKAALLLLLVCSCNNPYVSDFSFTCPISYLHRYTSLLFLFCCLRSPFRRKRVFWSVSVPVKITLLQPEVYYRTQTTDKWKEVS